MTSPTDYKCNDQRNVSRPLDVYREDDKIIISKDDSQMGVVALTEDERIVVINKLIKLK